jgi:hypothetical protein
MKGEKYTFINPYSIENEKEIITEQQGQKKIFIKDLANRLRLRETTNTEYLEKELDRLQVEITNNNFLQRAKRAIELLFLKHQELAKKGFFSLTELEKQESIFLGELKTMFLIDYCYPNQRKE